jgi:hypothetical protein
MIRDLTFERSASSFPTMGELDVIPFSSDTPTASVLGYERSLDPMEDATAAVSDVDPTPTEWLLLVKDIGVLFPEQVAIMGTMVYYVWIITVPRNGMPFWTGHDETGRFKSL